MPYDSEGNFTRVHNWEQDRQNDIDIMSDRMDEEFDNYANGMNDVMLRDGRCVMTGNLKMGNYQIKQLADGVSALDAINLGQLKDLRTELQSYADAIIPKGVIIPFAGVTAPKGFLLCDGSQVSRTTYSDLFAVIGTTYGAGNGSTTFTLPDYRDRTVFMRNDKSVGKVSDGSIPDHRHTMAVKVGTSGWEGGGAHNGSSTTGYASEDTSLFGSSLYSKTVNKVIPSHVSCNFIIKY